MRQRHLVLLAAIFFSTGSVFGQEPIAKSRIVSAGVFKNGLTIVKSEVTVPGAGTYRFEGAPAAVHGTFWIESNCKAEAAVKMREFDIPVQVGAKATLQEELADRNVTVHFKDPGKSPKVTGRVEKKARGNAGFLIIKTAKGLSYINPAEIASLDVEDEVVKARTESRPTLVLTVAKSEQKPVIFVTYVTRGLGWAPSYLVDITDPKKLSIEMSAVLRNDLAKLEDTDVKLISGSSNVQFAKVPSLLAPSTTFDKFLTALTAGREDTSLYNRNLSPDVTNNTIIWAVPNRLLLGASPDGEGVDLHFQSIGKRSLIEGEAQSLTVGKEKVDYERVVEWNVASSGKTDAGGEDIWDVLHFKNPFTFPVTAGPALVMEKGQFNGQRALHWANVGEETSLRITRSLSVRTLVQEREDSGKKPKDKIETIKIGNATYQLVTVQGELIMNNHRKQAIKMLVRRTISGKILSTEGNPKKLPREEGLNAINPSHDLLWTLSLAPGEEKTLRYRYSFLVGEGRAHW